MGTATAAGAAVGVTRYYGWRFLGIVPLGTEWGGAALDTSATAGCHRPKRILLDLLLKREIGPPLYPREAQFAVVRIGDALLGAAPAELTTTAGLRAEAAMRDSQPPGVRPDRVALLGLTNGYFQYVTTPEEYQAQTYEGGSTLYGPQSAPVYATVLRRLAGSLARGSPEVVVSPIGVRPGTLLRWPALEGREGTPTVHDAGCAAGAAWIRWRGGDDLMFRPRPGAAVRFTADTTVTDDDHAVEVRRIGKMWEARWLAVPAAAEAVSIALFPDVAGVERTASCRSR